jgi:hypothetical protein
MDPFAYVVMAVLSGLAVTLIVILSDSNILKCMAASAIFVCLWIFFFT